MSKAKETIERLLTSPGIYAKEAASVIHKQDGALRAALKALYGAYPGCDNQEEVLEIINKLKEMT